MAFAPQDDRPFAAARARGRPWQLSVVCVAGALLLLATWLHAATSGQGRAFGPGYVPYVLVTTGTLALALWGLWRMRPWAFWALPAAMAVDDAVVWAMGELRPGVVVVQTLVVLLVLAFKPRGSGWW
ncbi:MAG TPA: hypothetical protein VGG91_24455 [Myxococcaceae bacterium]|jgi:hypothetical protein